MKGRSRTARARLPILGTALLATAAMVATVAAGCGGGAGAAPKITTTARAGVAPVPPKEGAYFGAWVPPEGEGRPSASKSGSPSGSPSASPSESPSGTPSGSASASPSAKPTGKDADKPGMAPVVGFEQELGRQLDIVQTYRSWTSEFPAELEESVTAGNRYLLLTWGGADTKKIVQGEYDELVQRRARAVKALGKPVFLRWSRDMDKASNKKRVHSPQDFTAAWKHLRAIFKQERVDNVAWVWCPSARGFGGGDAPAYYPGDDQVDWICADAQPGADYEYRDLSEAVKMFLQWARDREKPIMIAEFGVPKSYGERRAEWLREASKTLQDPQVKAVVYFNSDEQAANARDKRRAYSVTGDKHTVSALRELATTPYFNPRNLPVTSGD
ncbi:glycoside hydrolase family 26 protein [Actinomadura sp. 1N219]|uniref:glycoside hydrolase family 26 protein n=1 Tax=Actinomadura sp. 1N219 TaxID=3375152 RepID=UPI0037A29BD8